MPDRGRKRQSGQTRARTVLKLLPVRYMVTFSYLGHDRIQRNDTDYRCKYKLEPGAQPGAPAFHERDPRRLPNVVPAGATADAAVKAATPSSQGGDNTNPPGDEVYRIMISDNHGMRSDDSNLLGRGGSPDGDRESKPDNYAKTGGNKVDWMPDIKPAVPFRIVVRKYVGTAQVDFDQPLKAKIEIKDPVEEFAQNDGNRRTFLQGFFNKYNRGSANPDVGDDNCPTLFQGTRLQTAAQPGVKATDVLKKAPYRSLPVADLPPSAADVHVQFSELSNADAQGPMGAKFDLQQVDERGKKIGVADLAFTPYPAFGDNFRFLITLINDSGQDVRDTRENGHPVEMTDQTNGAAIPKPRAYTTGRFILWKRMKIKMVVLINRTSASDLDWAGMKSVYRKSFIDIEEPDPAPNGYVSLRPEQWINLLKQIFPSATDTTALDALLTAAPPNDLNTVYGRFFFPAHLQNTKTRAVLRSAIDTFIRNAVTLACSSDGRNLEPPDSTEGRKQDKTVRDRNSEGFFVGLVRTLVDPATAPNNATLGNVRSLANLLGVSFGDRMFWFNNGSQHPGNTIQLTTNTLSHEMGHAQYLRHGITQGNYSGSGGGGGGDNGTWNGAAPAGGGAAPAAVAFDFFHSQYNCQLLDHDHNDAYNCLMSYSPQRVVSVAPCGVCDLTMRFYDRVKIQAAAEYQNQITQGLSPASIAQVTALNKTSNTAGAVVAASWTLQEPPLTGTPAVRRLPNLRVGNTMDVVCVSKEAVYDSQAGPGARGRVNLSCADTNAASLAFWRTQSTDGGAISLAVLENNRIQLTGTTPGTVTLSFSRNGVTAQAQITVVP